MKQTGIKPLDNYCEGVSSGDINVCEWVELAVERHYSDLKKAESDDYPYYFEPEAARHFFEFCSTRLKHYEGVFAGRPLELRPWQKFVFGSIFGWLKKKSHRTDSYDHIPIRRFREAIVIIPKKNGKSILSAAVALYMMDWDSWPGAQCYILAKNQSHAKDLGYRAATKMKQQDPVLDEKYRVNRSAAEAGVYYDENNSFYRPLTSNPDSEDGRNVHFCGPDETKDWTDFDIYDVMKQGTVNAPNSLFLSTTTAGHNRDSLGFEQQQTSENLLNPHHGYEDEATFAIIYTIDEEDKEGDEWWADEELWRKANPNYEISVFPDALKAMIPAARRSLNKRISFETKHLNIWHSSSEAFIPDNKWAKCGKADRVVYMDRITEFLEPFKGHKAWLGLDLGSVSDFTALQVIIEGEQWNVLSMYWIPEETIPDRRNSSMVREWAKSGYIKSTEGNVMDHNITREDILKVCEVLNVQEIAYDRYKMTEMVNNLMEQGLEMTPFGQGYVSMAPAVDNLETLILQEEIEHFGNPVLAWMNSNVTIRKDPAGNRKFDKEKSQDKIDGMVALAMGLSRACYGETESETTEWNEVKFI